MQLAYRRFINNVMTISDEAWIQGYNIFSSSSQRSPKFILRKHPCNIMQYFTAVKNDNFQMISFINIFVVWCNVVWCGVMLCGVVGWDGVGWGGVGWGGVGWGGVG